MSLEQVYDEEIAPLMTEIIAVAKRAGIKFIAEFQLDESEDVEDDWLMCTTVLLEGEGKTAPSLEATYEAIKPKRHVSMAFTITTINPDKSTGE